MNRVDLDAASRDGENELAALGFKASSTSGTWEADFDINDRPTRLFVSLPQLFPHELPIVKVDREQLGRQIPHVEQDGKVCIASSNGLLLDASRPAALVREAVDRAREVLGKGLRGENAADLQQEFSAYWASGSGRTVLTFIDVQGDTRLIALAEVTKVQGGIAFVVGDSPDELRMVADRIGLKVGAIDSAWFLRLQTPVLPPPFEAKSTLGFVGTLIRDHLDSASRSKVERWLTGGQTRLTFLFSFSLDGGRADPVFALRLKSQLPSNGFRPGKVPLGVAVGRSGSEQGERLSIQRGDSQFLQTRTGSLVDLTQKRVLLVGCGAVGGYLASCLADSGVGHLTFVDDDHLRSENAMRHVLGLGHVGAKKVEALKRFIQSRLPHVRIDTHDVRLDEAMAKAPDLARNHDVVLLATGDHTFELRVNDSLRATARLVHAWLEAYGVGGHVLVDGHSTKGCLACLFSSDEATGLYCRASFYEPGQDFSASVGGCAGTFTPFGSLDAQRAGIEAARTTLRVLQGQVTSSTLVSWLEPVHESNQLRLSARARQLAVGSRVEITEHAGCPRCTR